jgi:hypothetical protein
LIELARYNDYLGKNKWEWCYGAILIIPGGKPVWCPLGSAVGIEKNIRLYQECAHGEKDEATLLGVLHALHAQIWAPIEKVLPAETTNVAISPDGELNFVSFTTLTDSNDKFLAERYSIRYVASGRDLLGGKKSGGNLGTVIFADPDFEGKTLVPNSAQSTTSAGSVRLMEMRGLQNLLLFPLPGTAAEATGLQKLIERANRKVTVFLGSAATEAELRRVDSPRILHLATHGFFLPESELGNSKNVLGKIEDIPKGKLVDPTAPIRKAVATRVVCGQACANASVFTSAHEMVISSRDVATPVEWPSTPLLCR